MRRGQQKGCNLGRLPIDSEIFSGNLRVNRSAIAGAGGEVLDGVLQTEGHCSRHKGTLGSEANSLNGREVLFYYLQFMLI